MSYSSDFWDALQRRVTLSGCREHRLVSSYDHVHNQGFDIILSSWVLCCYWYLIYRYLNRKELILLASPCSDAKRRGIDEGFSLETRKS